MVKDKIESERKAAVLVEALPFIKRYAGKCVVIKVGGEILEDLPRCRSLVEDLILLKSVGLKVVLCHGGGPQITAAMQRLGKEAVFVDGHRVTDAETMEVAAMVLLGNVNARLSALINVHGPHAVGLSGIDAGIFKIEPEDKRFGFVGRIVAVRADLLHALLQQGYLPVVSPIAADNRGEPHNINADIAAGKLAAALGAEKLVVLTNVPGLYESFGDDESLIAKADKLRAMIASNAAGAGMRPKLEAVLAALEGGVPCAHLLDGRDSHALLLEIFTAEGIGTLITNGAYGG